MEKLLKLYKRINKFITKRELLKVSLYLFGFVFLTFAVQSVPNGLTLPMNGDYVLQQLHFYFEGYDAFWTFFTTGEFPLWSYRGMLGVNYFAANTFYYLTSPFMLPMLLVPRFLIPQMIFIMYMVKLTVGGLLMYVLLKRYFNNSYYASLIGATVYALSGWGMYYLWFNHFADVLAIFPLIFIGVEHLLKYKKGFLLVVGLFLMGLANYFFLFGFVILMFFYSLFRFIAEFKNNRGYNLKIFLIGGISFAIGIMLVGFVLLPAFNVIGTNPRIENSNLLLELINLFFNNAQRINGELTLGSFKTFSELLNGENLTNIFKYFFVFADRYAAETIPGLQTQLYPIATFFFPPVNNWDSLVFTSKLFDNVYSSLYISMPLALLLVPTVLNAFKSRKIIKIIATILLLIIPFTPFVYYLMGAFSQVYGRWQIFLVVVSIIAIIPIVDKFESIPNWWLDLSFGVSLALMSAVALYSNSIGKISTTFYKNYGIIAVIVLMTLTYIYLRFFFKKRVNLENLLYLITIELLIAGNVTQLGHGVANYWQLYGGRDVINEHQQIINDLNEADPSFYRIFVDLADRNNNNLSISLGYKGISTFHSIYSFELFEFLNDWSKIPYSYSNWSMGVDEKRIALDSFLNVKYYVLPKTDTNIPLGYSLFKTYPNFSVYKYDYHVELGYAFEAISKRQDFNIYYDYFQHEFYYNQLAVIENDDLEEILSLTNGELVETRTNLTLPFKQYNFINSNFELWLRGEKEPIIINDDIYFAGNYLPPNRENKFFGPFVAAGLGGDRIVSTLQSPLCPDASANNVCQVVLKLNYGPNIKVSFFNGEQLITEDSHGVSNYDKSGDQKFARSFYLNQPATRIELEFLGDAENNQFVKNGFALYYQYQNEFLNNQQELINNKLNNIAHTNNTISFETNYQTSKMIVLSVPYDEGWNLKINGVDSKIYKVNSGFIGIIAKPGIQNYQLVYQTPGLINGGLISLIGLMLFLMLLVYEFRRKKKG